MPSALYGKRFAALALLLAAAGLVCGCQLEGSQSLFPVGNRDAGDVVAIVALQGAYPWLRDADGRIAGIQTRTYFVSSQTGKGMFVPGVVEAILHVLQRQSGGGFERLPGYAWRFTERDATPFRVTRKALYGDSYGFILKWPPELDVMGRRVELQFIYRRGDGQEVRSSARQLLVPLPPGFADPGDRPFVPPLLQPPSPETSPAPTRPLTPPATPEPAGA